MKIWFRNRWEGNCEFLEEGLYYRIIAELPQADDSVCRLIALWGENRIPLGVMLPKGKKMELQKKIPRKSIVPEACILYVEADGGHFYPLAQVPLENLEKGSYGQIGNGYGIWISSSTGQ